MASAPTAAEQAAIGWASLGSAPKKRLKSSWSIVWIVIDPTKSSSCVRVGRVPVDQEIGDLEERALLGELLDRDAAVAQDPLLAVDEGDRALARARVRIARVERDVAGLRAQLC